MIENTIRSGKIDAGKSSRRSVSKRKENEVNNTSSYSKTVTVNQSKKVAVNQQGSSKQRSDTRQNTEKLQFTPIPIPYRELYQNLFNAHVVAPHHLKPLQPPYPKWYDANAQYDYHAGIVGHSIEHCTVFKKLVEKLISMGVVKLDDSPSTENPLPNHNDNGVNMIGGSMGRKIKEDISEVKIPLRWVWKNMECTEFRALVQGLMDNKEMDFYEEVKEDWSICTSESSKVPRVVQPVVIISRPKKDEVRTSAMLRIIIKKPATFPYQDSKKVPWNYECNTTVPGKETAKSQCVSANPESMKEATLGEQKGKVVEPVKEEEVVEFLKFLKYSEYNVVEQLHKQSARISVLSLLLNSEIHRSTLMKMLNKTYVSKDISVSKLDRLVNNISADNFIFFNDDEIPSGGMGSTKALHITARCKGRILSGVLIDNGSALNVLSLFTLNRLPIDSSHMKTCQNVVRAFDGTERKVMGRIEVPLLIGPTVYEVDFIVMDIKPSYNYLLGRPWIHSTGAVPSSLHQMLKLVSDGRLVTIKAEENMIIAVSNEIPYVETNDESVECSFRSLEFVNAAFVPEGSKILAPKLSKTTEMGLQLLVGKKALPGRGLERYLQGKIEVLVLKEKQDNFGLGYKPDRGQRRKEIEKRQERRKARLNGEEAKWEPMIIPHISKTFISGGVIH
ncbi:uncharacterized protein [Gossypium hirsutum]|uniref:G-patch domain-containing protein n=1 Tax=Gossypium hirsutum TaxID=3635 RepID=A0ABM2ZI64_GOSHI|nr:uncharacterized protein LOC107921535 [Gossypium hirsutum]